MIRGLAIQVARQANYFPVKGGVSSILSPRQLIEQRNLEFNKDFGIPFGSYVEAAQKTTNTAKARTRSAIYLGVSTNIQGGHEVMALDTGYELSTQKVTKLPISDVLIKRVEELAKNQGFKVLKFANRRGQPIFDASLIAGVDYEENLVPPNAPDAEQEQEDEEEEDSDDDSSSESNEEEEQEIVDHWEKDEEDLEIENNSNQKIHCNDGEMVLDKVNLDDQDDDSDSEDEPGSEDD